MRLKVKLVTGNGTGTSGNWKKKLRNLVRQTPEAQAGFTADATYPSGINVAYVVKFALEKPETAPWNV